VKFGMANIYIKSGKVYPNGLHIYILCCYAYLTDLDIHLKWVKLSLCLIKYHAMRTLCGNEGIASHILNLCTRKKWVVSFMLQLQLLYHWWKSPPVPTVEEDWWAPELVWT